MPADPHTSITTQLLSLSSHSYTKATKSHPFLVSAANGTLTDTLLSLWLSQDYIYAAQAYPRFVGSLISHIPFRPPTLRSSVSPDHSQRILKILVFALENIVREVGFFHDTSGKWGLDLTGWNERKGTRDYTAEMARISGTGKIEEGLLFLWAMEKVYLDAWSNINEKLSSREGYSALRSFATNWSTPEFKVFVDDLALLVDDVYRELGSDAWTVAEGIWQRVLELEEGFWPDAEEVY
ncbi:heme oxygenase-like protein [Lyophyllum atratum]|nr:heme oxygenase-like protein [Lyophyllum atratum]